MYKIGIIIAILASSMLASENPFAVEQNVKKIDQEEGTLLKAIAKEQAALEDEEDELFDEESSDTKKSDVKTEVEIVPPEVETETKRESLEVISEATTITVPSPKVVESPEAAKEKVEIKKSEVPEATLLATETKELEVSLSESVVTEPKVQEVEQEVVRVEPIKVVIPKVAPVVIPKKETAKEIDIKIREVDAEIKKLQNNLDASKEKLEAPKELKGEGNASVPENSIFEKELQEAIESVRN